MKTNTRPTILILSAIVCFIAGCPKPVDIVYPILLQDGTLGLEPKWSDKTVVQLKILTRDKTLQRNERPVIPAWFGPCGEAVDFGDVPSFKPVWHIRATAEVLAKDFIFVPGAVPGGFEQVVPDESEHFIPVRGREYFILVCLDPIDDSIYSFGKTWIP